MQFSDEEIIKCFGADAAEDEHPRRLREYFFRNKTYQNIRSSVSLRLLVGHKGIGKSALLRMSHMEDQDEGTLSLWLQPNDLILERSKDISFLEKVKGYKILLSRSIFNKALDELGVKDKEGLSVTFSNTAKQIINGLAEKISSSANVDYDRTTAMLRRRFQEDKEVRVYIDDIDRGWTASKDDINNISALVNAARDLTNEDKNLKIRIGLRSDAYFLYRTSDESTDKIESNVIRMNWTRHDVIIVMALRVASYLNSATDLSNLPSRPQKEIARELDPVLESPFTVGRGHWNGVPTHVVLLSLNRNRPRDLIKLLTQAGKEAYRNENVIIKSSDLENVFANYSSGRITDLTLEFQSELPGIEKLLYGFSPNVRTKKENRWLFSNDSLIKKIRNIRSNHNFFFANGQPTTDRSIAEFLYKIDFIIARDNGPDGRPNWTHFDQNRMLQSQFVDFGYHWEIHPAYRWALQPRLAKDILDSIEI